MAKKKQQVRRVPRAQEPRMYGDGKPSQAAQQSATATQPVVRSTGQAPARVTTGPRIPVTVTQDYRYVLKDLRRLGIVASGIFALLIVLGIVVR